MRRIIILISCLMASVFAHGQSFITRDGSKLMYQGEEILLRGMSFGNLVWEDQYHPSLHHTEIDFERVEALGMNAIRFYLNYKTFEDDQNPFVYKQDGWNWLDQNIQWAKSHNIFLILNMHVPQGGFQSQCNGDTLWTNLSNQDRLSALWKAIAQQYKDEPQIAGYDILNEPTPSGSITNWTNLAQRIIDSIRSVDQNHLIITERALALGCDYGYNDENYNYPQIQEENLMYTLHLYDPYEYTHQLMNWAGTGDGGKYPDTDRVSPPSDAQYATGHYANPSIQSGTTDWTYYEGQPFEVTVDSIVLGRVVFLSNGIASGRVYFDDFVLTELDAQGNTIRTIFAEPLTAGTYWWWSANGTGNYSPSTIGHNDNYSISVSGNTESATVIGSNFPFKAIKGNRYVVSGWMKGDNIPAGASASISTEYYYSPSGQAPHYRDYAYMKHQIEHYSQYVVDKGFPVYYGEFGAGRVCFENNKGGEKWVADVLKIFDSLGFHFTYHSYKESSFGYYDGWQEPIDPSTVNTALREVFESFFGVPPTTSLLPSTNELRSAPIVYPNPTNDLLYLQHDKKIDRIEIVDLLGNPVFDSQTLPVSISQLSSGTYVLKVISAEGVHHLKFVKQ
jgi:endoglucanase